MRPRALAIALLLAVLAAACGDAAAGESGEPPADDRSSASFIGLTLDAAGERADRQARAWRVITLDGEEQAITADFQAERLNFTVERGIVVAAITDAEWVEGS